MGAFGAGLGLRAGLGVHRAKAVRALKPKAVRKIRKKVPTKKVAPKKTTPRKIKPKKEYKIGIRQSARLALKNLPIDEEEDDESSTETESDSEESTKIEETKEVSEEIKKDKATEETKKDSEKEPEIPSDTESEPKAKRSKLEKKSSSMNLSTDEAVTMDEARRLAKKSLARSKVK